jgi:phage repressor protein C with HTH and peptisase S24 domain
MIGVSKQTINAYSTGAQLPGGENLLALAKTLGVSLDWLLIGEEPGEPLEPARPNGAHDLTPADLDRYVKINRYDVEANAGHGALVLDEKVVDQLTFKREWIIGEKHWEPARLALLRVRGDSMEPTLCGGDLILVNTAPAGLHDGLHVIRVGEDLLVKRLRRIGPNAIQVISDNRELYPPYEATLDDGLDIIGEVVWFCRELK